jgi:putative phage-type endonuclease
MSEFIESDICEEEDMAEVVEYIQQLLDLYLDICDVPKRSGMRRYRSHIVTETLSQSVLKEQIEHLKRIPQPAQRTPEWYAFRNSLISASSLWKVFGTDSQQNSIIYEKCKAFNQPAPTTSESTWVNTESSMHWGVKYEPVSVMVYESMFQTKLTDFGCIRHPMHYFIGASPDGIVCDDSSPLYGRMVEIKNIVNREITGIPKLEYWVQTQIQMETCDLAECDFFETRFLEYANEAAYWEDETHDYKGTILYFIKQGFEESLPVYKYMPLGLTATEGRQWIDACKTEQRTLGYVLFSTIHWYLCEFSCVLIERNPLWFRAALPKIAATWETIQREAVSGYDHRGTKKQIESTTNKITVLGTDTSSSYVVRNMPPSKSVCLVKLDF